MAVKIKNIGDETEEGWGTIEPGYEDQPVLFARAEYRQLVTDAFTLIAESMPISSDAEHITKESTLVEFRDFMYTILFSGRGTETLVLMVEHYLNGIDGYEDVEAAVEEGLSDLTAADLALIAKRSQKAGGRGTAPNSADAKKAIAGRNRALAVLLVTLMLAAVELGRTGVFISDVAEAFVEGSAV